MKLWFVDDKRENHETWSNSFAEPLKQACELRSFYDIATLIDELHSGNIPDILFLDFFIGERLGIEVIRWFEGKDDRPVLIAHSSMNVANEGMVTEGADFWLEKVKNRTHTDSIMRVFKSLEDLASIAKNRAIPQDP